MPDTWNRIGDILELRNGSRAEVMLPTEDGQWVLVRYLSGGKRLELVGRTDLTHADEIFGVLSSARN